MYLVSATRTMANAKFDAPVDDGIVRKTVYPKQRDEEFQQRIRQIRLERAQSTVSRKELELRAAKERLASVRHGGRYNYARIEAIAMVTFGLSRTELVSNRRHKRVAFARQFIAYWCCRLTEMSLPQIGKRLGGRDHTTILHGKKAYVAKRKAMGRTLREVR
jgi:chromosomal replication initiation ATPase DnaA